MFNSDRFFTLLEHEIDEIMEHFVTDGNGQISLKEFVTLMHKLREKQDTEEVRATFKMFDKDGDGRITPNEFKTTIKNIGLKLSDGQISVMMEEADINGDGVIDYKEFMALAAKYWPKSND